MAKEIFRRHEVLCNYCGGRFKVWRWLWILKFIVLGDCRYVVCPYCNRVSMYRFHSHSPHDVVGSDEGEQHKKLEEVWKNG